jgi:Secretion system C-terminal sorting domain
MKILILLPLSFTISFSVFSQNATDNYLLNFEDPITLQYLINDTLNPNNIWRVGAPQKNIFTSAYSTPNSIVTDLHNPYPVNDTSSFIITYVMKSLGVHEYMGIGGYFMSNTDSLLDFGKLEVSFDHGLSWIDLMDDSVIQNYFLLWETDAGYGVLPSFTGNSNGWQWFDVDLYFLYDVNSQQYGDTSLYRFTFISDGNQTNKDGLMFDDLYAYNGTLLNTVQLSNYVSSNVFPVPASDRVVINFLNENNDVLLLQIFNSEGKEVKNIQSISGESVLLNISDLPSGIYIYKLSNLANGFYSLGKFVKE